MIRVVQIALIVAGIVGVDAHSTVSIRPTLETNSVDQKINSDSDKLDNVDKNVLDPTGSGRPDDELRQMLSEFPPEYFEKLKNKSALEAMKIIVKDGALPKLLRFNQKNMQSRSEQDLKKVMLQNLDGNPAGEILKKKPDLAHIIIKVFRDEKAVNGISNFFEDSKKLKGYAIFLVVTFLFSFFFFNSGGRDISLSKRLMRKVIYFGFINSFRIVVFAFLFGNHFWPSIKIAFNHFQGGI